jgi:hypothetical protein
MEYWETSQQHRKSLYRARIEPVRTANKIRTTAQTAAMVICIELQVGTKYLGWKDEIPDIFVAR